MLATEIFLRRTTKGIVDVPFSRYLSIGLAYGNLKIFFFKNTFSGVIFDVDHESDILFAIWGIFTMLLSRFTKIFKKIFFLIFSFKNQHFSIRNNKEHQNNYSGGMNWEILFKNSRKGSTFRRFISWRHKNSQKYESNKSRFVPHLRWWLWILQLIYSQLCELKIKYDNNYLEWHTTNYYLFIYHK